jgi:hypothetical protein
MNLVLLLYLGMAKWRLSHYNPLVLQFGYHPRVYWPVEGPMVVTIFEQKALFLVAM